MGRQSPRERRRQVLAGQAGGLVLVYLCTGLRSVTSLSNEGIRPDGDPSFYDPFILGIKRSPRERPLGPRQEGTDRKEGQSGREGIRVRKTEVGDNRGRAKLDGRRQRPRKRGEKSRGLRSQGQRARIGQTPEEGGRETGTGWGGLGRTRVWLRQDREGSKEWWPRCMGAAGWSRGPGR